MKKTAEHKCEPVTPVMRAIDNVPAGARWRISWVVRAFTPPRRVWSYVLRDEVAQRWCARHGVAMPAAASAEPAVGAGRPDVGVLPHVARFTTEAADRYGYDVRSRAAGEES